MGKMTDRISALKLCKTAGHDVIGRTTQQGKQGVGSEPGLEL